MESFKKRLEDVWKWLVWLVTHVLAKLIADFLKDLIDQL